MFKRFHKKLYVNPRFFAGVFIVVASFILAYVIPQLEFLTTITVLGFLAICLADIALLFIPKHGVLAKRTCPEMLSLSDENIVDLAVENNYRLPIKIRLVDELPYQFEIRDFAINHKLGRGERKEIKYPLQPFRRGEYHFGSLLVYASNRFPGFFERKFVFDSNMMAKVYPSVIQMREMELKAFAQLHELGGIKKIRRIGHSYEFDQISEYVQGDDYRSINWKATGRTTTLMVNRYEDERSQPVYCLVDASRNMKMPFYRLSLLDYAINASLVISNIVLKKSDKAGLLTFSSEIHGIIKAQNSPTQLNRILETLYNLDQSGLESDYERLYHVVTKTASVRGLLFLFTNFESIHSLNRVKHLLSRLNKQHLLVVIFFENTEIDNFARQKTHDLEEVYRQTISEQYVHHKELMVKELAALRIQTILTKPEELNINVINKYLELKARGLI